MLHNQSVVECDGSCSRRSCSSNGDELAIFFDVLFFDRKRGEMKSNGRMHVSQARVDPVEQRDANGCCVGEPRFCAQEVGYSRK